jgi:hypothetical protein
MRIRAARKASLAGGVAGVILSLLALGWPVSAAAAGPVFGSPSAVSTFLTGIVFRQPVSSVAIGTRAEIVVSVEGSASTLVSVVPTAASASQTLSYEVALGPGGAVPGTQFEARWRLTSPSGDVRLGPPVSVTYDDDRFNWQTLDGEVVHMHWYSGSAAFGRQALAIAEDGVASASTLLGVDEHEPIDFFVYADVSPFYDVLGPASRENIGGVAYPNERVLLAQIDTTAIDDAWVRTVIPHELTHIVFDGAVSNPYHGPPKWLNEGVAVYLSEGFTADRKAEVAEAVTGGQLMGLDALVGQFPTSRDRFSLAYSESVSAVDYLVRAHGRDALVGLIRSYAGGVSDDEAFKAGPGVDVAGFEAGWLADLGASAPATFGPQPAPAGPLPADWTGPGPTAGVPSSEPVESAGNSPAPVPPGDEGGSGVNLAVALAGLIVVAVAGIAGAARWRRGRAPVDGSPPADASPSAPDSTIEP